MTKEERKEYLLDGLQKHYKYIESLGYNVVGVFLQGSQNYNLDIYTDEYMSDIDTKAIILPTLEDLVKGNKMVSKTYDFMDAHAEVKDIRLVLEIWTKQNQSYLEMLFTDFYILNPLYEPYMRQILDMGEKIAQMNPSQLLKCISGMSKEKVVALCHPYPTIKHKIDKFGWDGKQLHHTIRLNHFMNRLFVENLSFKNSLPYNNADEVHFMLKVKKNIFPDNVKDAKEMAEKYDEATKNLKHSLINEKYPEGEFDAETLNQLKDIINEMVRYNIILQVKDM